MVLRGISGRTTFFKSRSEWEQRTRFSRYFVAAAVTRLEIRDSEALRKLRGRKSEPRDLGCYYVSDTFLLRHFLHQRGAGAGAPAEFDLGNQEQRRRDDQSA